MTVVSRPQLAAKLGLQFEEAGALSSAPAGFQEAPAVFNAEEQKIAKIAYDVIRKFETQPNKLPSVTYLQRPEVQAAVLQEVTNQYRPAQMELDRNHKAARSGGGCRQDSGDRHSGDDRHPPYSRGAQGRGEIRLSTVHARSLRHAI